MAAKRKLIIDTDAGIDDAQAILMALASTEVDVIGITTANGNTTVDQVSRNVLRLLKVANRLDIPIYQGTSAPMLGNTIEYTEYHGKDGFGDVPDPEAPDEKLIQKEHAVPALIRMVNQHQGQVSLVCLAPLTNIALALRIDPAIGKKLKDCYIMGGNYEGKGNITASAEFNFYTDPESAYVVLKDLGCPITMACWELCTKLAFSWEWYKEFVGKDTAKAKFMKGIEAQTLEKYYHHNNADTKYETADQIVMAACLNPTVVTSSKEVVCTVELAGNISRGSMVVDWKNSTGNVTLLMDIDQLEYGNLLQNSLV